MTTAAGNGLFAPIELRGVALRNRVVISPMQQYMGTADGLPTDWHFSHCSRLALGDRHTIIELGRTVYSGAAEQFAADEAVRARYLTLEHK